MTTYPSKPLIIGVSGKMRAGKDTFYQLASQLLPDLDVKQVAFADKVKEFASSYFGVTPEDDKEDIRFILQGIGHMFREEVSEDFWINIVLGNLPPCDVVMVTDMRYENERARLREVGTVVRVESSYSLPSDHPSEVGLDGAEFDFVVQNHGTIDEYREEVRRCLQLMSLL